MLSQLQVVALPRTTEKQVRLFEFCLASSSCIPWHTVSSVSTQINPNSFLACIFAILRRGRFRRHLQNVPIQSLHVWQPTQDLLADILRWHHPRILPRSTFDHT